MAWNGGYRGDWQEGWNGWKSNPNVWYDQTTEGSYAHNPDEYSSWQQHPQGAMGHQSSGGFANVRPSANAGQLSRAEPPKPKVCSFDALRALQGDSDCDSDREGGSSRRHASTGSGSGGSGSSPMKSRSDSSDDNNDREVGKGATQQDCEEAAEVVRTALQDQKERDRMRKQISTGCNAGDLQAMLNSRLKR